MLVRSMSAEASLSVSRLIPTGFAIQHRFAYVDHTSESANIINVARRLTVTKQCEPFAWPRASSSSRLIRPNTLTNLTYTHTNAPLTYTETYDDETRGLRPENEST